MNPPLPLPLLEAIGLLDQKVYLVGGAVRDLLRGVPFSDADLVLQGASAASLRLSRRLHAKRITLDEKFQIFRLILRSPVGNIQVVDLAEMTGGSIEADLARRDFTVNAMALSLTDRKTIIDPFGGRADLKKKIIRAVSKKAFAEDPLRRLRAFRFMAQLEFKIDPRTIQWVKSGDYGKVAVERLRQEWMHLMAAPHSAPALRLMDACGLLAPLFPSLEACRRTAGRFYGKGGVLRHALASVENLEWLIGQISAGTLPAFSHPRLREYLYEFLGGYPRFALLKTAELLHDVGKPGTAEMIKGRMRFFEHEHVGADLAFDEVERLRFSRQEALHVRSWVKNHMRLGNLAAAPHMTDKAVSRYFRDLGDDGIGMLLMSLGDHYTYLSRGHWGKQTDLVEQSAAKMIAAYLTEKEKVIPKRLIDGHQLMKALRINPGPIVGKLLAAIEDAQVSKRIQTPEAAIAWAKQTVKRLRG